MLAGVLLAGDRLRDDHELQRHRRHGPGVPARGGSGLASGVTLGAAIGVGGVAAVLLGVLADAAGLDAVMWTIALLPIAGLLLALTLPESGIVRRRRGAVGHVSSVA